MRGLGEAGRECKARCHGGLWISFTQHRYPAFESGGRRILTCGSAQVGQPHPHTAIPPVEARIGRTPSPQRLPRTPCGFPTRLLAPLRTPVPASRLYSPLRTFRWATDILCRRWKRSFAKIRVAVRRRATFHSRHKSHGAVRSEQHSLPSISSLP